MKHKYSTERKKDYQYFMHTVEFVAFAITLTVTL